MDAASMRLCGLMVSASTWFSAGCVSAPEMPPLREGAPRIVTIELGALK